MLRYISRSKCYRSLRYPLAWLAFRASGTCSLRDLGIFFRDGVTNQIDEFVEGGVISEQEKRWIELGMKLRCYSDMEKNGVPHTLKKGEYAEEEYMVMIMEIRRRCSGRLKGMSGEAFWRESSLKLNRTTNALKRQYLTGVQCLSMESLVRFGGGLVPVDRLEEKEQPFILENKK